MCLWNKTILEELSLSGMISKTYDYPKTYKKTGSYRKKRIIIRARLEFDYHLTHSKVTEDKDYIKRAGCGTVAFIHSSRPTRLFS